MKDTARTAARLGVGTVVGFTGSSIWHTYSTTDPARLAGELAEIRRAGLAYDREEAAPGVGCVAAPALVRGQAVAALSVTLPSEHTRTAGTANAVRVVSLTLARAGREKRRPARPCGGDPASAECVCKTGCSSLRNSALPPGVQPR